MPSSPTQLGLGLGLGLQQRKGRTASTDAVTTEESELLSTVQPLKKPHQHQDDNGHVLVPLQQRSLLVRYDTGPFIVLYIILALFDRIEVQGLYLLQMVALPLAFASHLALVLAQQWRVSIRCKVGYATAKSSLPGQKWTHCWVQAPATESLNQDADVVPIRFEDNVAVVNFRDVIFRAALADGADVMDTLFLKDNTVATVSDLFIPKFYHLKYPVDLVLDFYKEWRGHVALKSIGCSQKVYGANTTQIELPPFLDILGPQLLAPFFLFQLLCVVLWSMDEYWYYAIFTLFALVMFECTMAFNRLKSLERLRGTLRHAYAIYVYRHNLWIAVKTDELTPGDIVSLSERPIVRQQHLKEIHVPADILLLEGNAVVDEALLTGESTPQLKGPLDTSSSNELVNLDIQDSQHKQSVLFGGTVLVSHDSSSSTEKNSHTGIPLAPNGGVVGFVLRTGFETAQGSLLRTMTHTCSQNVDGIHTRDTFVFVALLLICAVASAGAVLLEGWYDETRNRFRLILHVIIIVTSVVPPELPMELSLAVTNSVADLMKRCRVFCTEPYRIPWAGRVDVCCFDKTGTLTSDQMSLSGVRLSSVDELIHPSTEGMLPWPVMRVMVACHSLAIGGREQDGGIMGDPLERAVFNEVPYQLKRNGTLVAEEGVSTPNELKIHHRFAFSSRLKRMTVLATERTNDKNIWALTKGAPEIIKTFLEKDSLPSDYDEIYTHYMSLGQRVLAMAYRELGKNKSISKVKEEGRDAIEQKMIFAGFLVLECPLKSDSKSIITELRKSNHYVVMITGDALLTAAEVARQVGIIHIKKSASLKHIVYELRERPGTQPISGEEGNTIAEDIWSKFVFSPLTSRVKNSIEGEISLDGSISLTPANIKMLREMVSKSEASVCVSGEELTKIAIAAIRNQQKDSDLFDACTRNEKNVLLQPKAQDILKDLVPLISVFARHAPRQKEAVVHAFNLGGSHTLMCGDGTNDVGALKRAHVGISIISAPELEAKERGASKAIAKIKAEERRERKKKKSKSKESSSSSRSKKHARQAVLQESLRQMRQAQEELDYVELGDASVASPFTSRAMSIKCVKDVLQQGRCTLVTMLTIYKILGVSCLVNALVLTKLHMYGVKQGDRQITALGIAVAILFLLVTRGRPLATLSPCRPPSSVLCTQALLSISVQFLVHCVAIMIATHVSLSFVDPWDPSMIPDGPFNPNVLNSCTFLLTVLATINTFVVNYRGRPFMEDLRDNKMLVRCAQICYGVIFVCALEVFPPLNDLLQLAPFPDSTVEFSGGDNEWNPLEGSDMFIKFVGEVGFPIAMSILMVVDTVLSYIAEKTIVRIFED